jgi:hypothetical protein
VLLTPVLVTPIRLLLVDLLPLILLGRHTKSMVHGLIGRQLGGCSGVACPGAVKTPISASLWHPLNEVPWKQKI